MPSLVSQLHSTFNLAFHSPCTRLIAALFAPIFSLAVVEVKWLAILRTLYQIGHCCISAPLRGELCCRATIVVAVQELAGGR